MKARDLAILGAPTNLGNRPYEVDGTARQTTGLPRRLREAGVVRRLGARDLGDVAAAPYRDYVFVPGTIRNEDLVHAHARSIADAVAAHDGFTLVLGGDCSTILGCLAGLRRSRNDLAVVYFDAHDDFNTLATTITGAVAGMDLAIATGRVETPLARLDRRGTLLRDEDVVTVGVRERVVEDTPFRNASTAEGILAALGDREFFIHVDADVLDPAFMPWVDSPTPGGLHPDDLASMLRALLALPGAAGMELTIYDPRNDREGKGA
ncbi:MAG TPA: arginase family protein, partial [Thermoanaerobaculia bacterium]